MWKKAIDDATPAYLEQVEERQRTEAAQDRELRRQRAEANLSQLRHLLDLLGIPEQAVTLQGLNLGFEVDGYSFRPEAEEQYDLSYDGVSSAGLTFTVPLAGSGMYRLAIEKKLPDEIESFWAGRSYRAVGVYAYPAVKQVIDINPDDPTGMRGLVGYTLQQVDYAYEVGVQEIDIVKQLAVEKEPRYTFTGNRLADILVDVLKKLV